MARSKTSNFFVWVIMGLLAFGLVGFGANGLSGTVRSIGKVGDKSISVQSYAHALNQEIAALDQTFGRRLSFQEAEQLGITQQVQQRVISQASLDNEAANIGLSVGDEQVREQVLQVPQFRGLDGSFDREAYREALSRNGQTEGEFETAIRDDATRVLLQSAVAGGTSTNDAYAKAILNYIAARRDFTWGFVTEEIAPVTIEAPTDSQLLEFFEANPKNYTLPEAKKITYAALLPDQIIDTVDVDETAVKEMYQERKSEFETPERRLVERLVFGDDVQAHDAADRVASGEITFEALVEERGLSLSDADMGDVTREELDAAAEVVFAAETGSVVGPAPSNLGPALYRVNAVLAEQITPKDMALNALREELALDRTRRVIDDLSVGFDERLAGGATLEELAAESDMELGTLDWTTASEETIAAYSRFRDAAQAVGTEDFPEILRLADGGIFALRLDEVFPERVQDFADVEATVTQDWTTAETQKVLLAEAERLATELSNDANPADLGLVLTTETNITRRDFIQGTTPAFIEAIFEMDLGETRALDLGTSIVVMRLDNTNPPDDAADETPLLLNALKERASAGISQDLLSLYGTAVQLQSDVSLNQNALNAVHSSFGHGGR